jgi:hypothetical protein
MKVKVFFLFLILVLLVFAKDFSLVASVVFREPHFFLGKSNEVTLYNDVLSLAQSGDYESAKSLLRPLLSSKNLSNPSDVYELYGDIIFILSQGTGDILPFYKKSLAINPTNPRIAQKIALLEIKKTEEKKEQNSQTGTKMQNPQTQTGADSSLSAKKEELQKLQSQRSGIMRSSEQNLSQK